MIKQILLIVLVSTFKFATAQEALSNTNLSATEYYRNNDFSKACEALDEFADDPDGFYVFGAGLILLEVDKSIKKPIKFFDYLRKSESKCNKIGQEIFSFLSLRNCNKKELLILNQEFKTYLDTLQHPTHFTTLFAFLSYKELKRHNLFTLEQKVYLVKKLIDLNEKAKDSKNEYTNSTMHRFLDIHLQSELFQKGYVTIESLFKSNFLMSDQYLVGSIPFANDKRYFETVHEIRESAIKKSQGKISEAILFDLKIINEASNPTKKGMKMLKAECPSGIQFEKRWFEVATSTWNKVDFNERIASYLSDNSKSNQWLVVDVWGTWCGPCVAELPKWNSFYEKNKTISYSNLAFMTISYSSTKIDDFMNSNKYSFPYLEVTKEEIKKMKINSFPTTYLISPEWKSTIISFGTNKIELIELFTLMKE